MSHHTVNIPVDDEISLDQTPLVEEATTDERQEARKVDTHLIEVKETNGQDRSGLQKNKSVSQIFDEMLEGLDISCVKSTTIFKVHAALRKSNPDAYTPKMISIGPYHKENPELPSMKKYKLLYLQRFLKRKEGINKEICIKELEKLKDEALKCYDDGEVKTGQFLQMLLLDGCFVVEFIRERCRMIPSGENKIINRNYMYKQLLRRDLLLLENQLPFFVLTKLHQMTMDKDEVSLLKLVKLAFRFWIPEKSPEIVHEKHNHLLQIVHSMSCQRLKREISDDKPPFYDEMPNATELSEAGVRSSKVENLSSYDKMPNATELSEAGVRFSKVENLSFNDEMPNATELSEDNHEDSRNLLEIKFKNENGSMEIPCLVVHDDTETILRNLVAYEQQSFGIKLRYFSDYVAFMDTLIESEKDVALLRERGIIRNMIGERKKVADIFNKIGNGVVTSPYNNYNNFFYQEECRKATKHCENGWNRRKANLRRNYFNTPWKGVSTVAATILLFLTVTQTVLAFISVPK